MIRLLLVIALAALCGGCSAARADFPHDRDDGVEITDGLLGGIQGEIGSVTPRRRGTADILKGGTYRPCRIKREAVRCRITFYHPHQDKWGARVAMQGVDRAIQGVTVAMAKDVEFGRRVQIPALRGMLDADDWFVCQDRGTAVSARKASGGRTPVVDVYCSSVAVYRRMVKAAPTYAIVVFEMGEDDR